MCTFDNPPLPAFNRDPTLIGDPSLFVSCANGKILVPIREINSYTTSPKNVKSCQWGAAYILARLLNVHYTNQCQFLNTCIQYCQRRTGHGALGLF